MSLVTVALKTTFQFGASPKTFKFEDITDYASQSVGLHEITGVIKVVDPDGNLIYNNTDHTDPDIDPDVSLIGVKTIPLPLLADGTVMQGNYVITYTVRCASGTCAPAFDVSETTTHNLVYVSPSVSLTMTSDCVKPLLKSVDGTSYLVNSVDPTITRAHTINYPESLKKTPITGTGSTLETNVFYTIAGDTLKHSSSLVSTLSYTYASNFLVTDSVSGAAFENVACDAQLCDIYCCLRAEWKRYESYKTTNKHLRDVHLQNWHIMMGLTEKIRIAIECGKGGDIAGYLATILELGNCEAGCGCNDGTPTLVTGLGGSVGTVVVESGGAPVVVTTSTSGSITTYTVTLASDFVDKVNNSYNSTVAEGTDITVTTVIDAEGNRTDTVAYSGSTVTPDILSFFVEIAISETVAPTITVTGKSKYGSAFNSSFTLENDNPANTDWLAKRNSFTVASIWTAQGGKVYKASINTVQQKDRSSGAILHGDGYMARIWTNNSTDFKFTLGGVTGNSLGAKTRNIKLQITLIA